MEQEQKDIIIENVKSDRLDVEGAFIALAADGICPCLLNDDFGNWAVTFDGYQSIPNNPGTPSDIESSFYVKADKWKKTIKEALMYALYNSL